MIDLIPYSFITFFIFIFALIIIHTLMEKRLGFKKRWKFMTLNTPYFWIIKAFVPFFKICYSFLFVLRFLNNFSLNCDFKWTIQVLNFFWGEGRLLGWFKNFSSWKGFLYEENYMPAKIVCHLKTIVLLKLPVCILNWALDQTLGQLMHLQSSCSSTFSHHHSPLYLFILLFGIETS